MRIHANQGHCYANQVVMRIHTPRALLCKPSRDGDSRKQRAFMQTGRIHTENRISSLYGIARENGRKRRSARKQTRNRKWIHMIRANKGLSSSLALVHLTSHLAQRSVNRPPPPLRHPTLTLRHPTSPPLAISHLFRRDLVVKLRTKPRPPPGSGESGSAFSVHQPCE